MDEIWYRSSLSCTHLTLIKASQCSAVAEDLSLWPKVMLLLAVGLARRSKDQGAVLPPSSPHLSLSSASS